MSDFYYHYTDEDSAEKIVNSRRIKASGFTGLIFVTLCKVICSMSQKIMNLCYATFLLLCLNLFSKNACVLVFKQQKIYI